MGDNDGIVVIPEKQVSDSIAKSIQREDKEEATKKRLRAGETTMEIYNWPDTK